MSYTVQHCSLIFSVQLCCSCWYCCCCCCCFVCHGKHSRCWPARWSRSGRLSPPPLPPTPPPPPTWTVQSPIRREIRLTESNAKSRYLKNWALKGLCGRCFICILSPPMTPYSPNYILYTCIQYTYSHREGGGDSGELTREKVRGAIDHKIGRKYKHDWLYLQSINSIKHQWRQHLGFGFFIVN